MPNLTPPGPPTGFAHAKCYLASTENCSREISGEHIVSASVLRSLGDVSISGAHWLETGQTRELSINSFRSNILCKRHNEALSPLDTEAGRFFRELGGALDDLGDRAKDPKPIFHIFSGEILERWFAKTTLGLYYGFGSVGGQRIKGRMSIAAAKATRALLEGVWEDNTGLYLSGAKGSEFTPTRSVSAAPLRARAPAAPERIVGATVGLHGFWFDLVFDAEGANDLTWNGRTRRPGEIVIREGGRTHSFLLTWPPGTLSTILNLSRAGLP